MSEFWAHDKWPRTVVPRTSWWRILRCRLIDHKWETSYWTGMGEEGWPIHDYCERCFRFRDKVKP